MSLDTGRKLGRYEIRSKIGAGGMGEVYLAQDTKLDRKVALKILPAEVAAHPERMRRFVQEAKTASGLNHPNILTIYEIDETDSAHFIATEFIDGRTLREHLRVEPLRLGEVLDVAVQIAGALAAAHAAGIVHRDIKPDNVMVRRDGIIKVLDFGIAKLIQADKPAIDTEVATKPLVRTEPGRVMGTVAYMSPEQLRGLDLDARTDIWSFGVVLYEMAAGCAPFTGETSSHVGVSILEKEPAPLGQFVPNVPTELQRIVRKALAKERDDRYQSARDLLIDLKNLRRELDLQGEIDRSTASSVGASGAVAAGTTSQDASHVSTSQPSSDTTAAAAKSSTSWLVLAIAGVAVAALLAGAMSAVYFGWLRRSESTGAFQKTEITQLTTSRNLTQVAISPDGKYVAYAISDNEKQSLWLRQSNVANDIQVIAPALVDYEGITFTRDSSWLYYVTRDQNGVSSLLRVAVLGGTSQKLRSPVDSPITFSPDGKRMAFVRGKYPSADQSALLITNSDGSDEKILATRRAPQFFYPISNRTGPSWSPDGELIACAVMEALSTRVGNVFTFAVKDGTAKKIMPKDFSEVGRVEWLADMSGLVIVGTEKFLGTFPGQVFHVSYPDGASRRITNDFGSYRGLSITSDASKLVTISSNELYDIWSAPEGDATRARQILPVGRRASISWTPEGRIVYATMTGGRSDIWIMNPDGSGRRQLTSDAEQNIDPSVSPDGRYVAFYSTRDGGADVWRINIDGSNPQRLTKGLLAWQESWTPDGQWILFLSYPDWRIWKVPIAGGTHIAVTDRPSYRPVVSPDGKMLACFYSDSTAEVTTETVYHLALLPLEGGAPIRTFPFRGGGATFTYLQWTPDGRAILYNATNQNVSNIWSQPVDGGPPKQITDFKDLSITSFGWSRDGRTFACTRGTVTSDVVMISQVK